MAETETNDPIPTEVRPRDVILKALMNRSSAPMDILEIEIIEGFLTEISLEHLGTIARKCVNEMTDEQLATIIRARLDGIRKSHGRKRAA